jgi:hypothetical protein
MEDVGRTMLAKGERCWLLKERRGYLITAGLVLLADSR